MFSPATLGIIGTVTGIVGAISGHVGLVLGCANYRRLQQIKALDLRLELRKQVSDVRADIEALPALLDRARASRSAVRAAMGRGQQSGDNMIWKAELENDLKTMQALACELPDAKEMYQRSKPQKLENKLVEVHGLAAKAAQLRNKYETALAYDDKDRDHIRADVRTRFK
jgi:chromosome segregation ATPase